LNGRILSARFFHTRKRKNRIIHDPAPLHLPPIALILPFDSERNRHAVPLDVATPSE